MPMLVRNKKRNKKEAGTLTGKVRKRRMRDKEKDCNCMRKARNL
jgi:hypothetical protein